MIFDPQRLTVRMTAEDMDEAKFLLDRQDLSLTRRDQGNIN